MLEGTKEVNILVYGAGAIGCHIGYCMYEAGNTVYLLGRGEHYKQMKENGMHIKICDNEILKHEQVINEDSMFYIMDDVKRIKDVKFDYIFITVKLSDYNENALQSLYPLLEKIQLLFLLVQSFLSGGSTILRENLMKDSRILILTNK